MRTRKPLLIVLLCVSVGTVLCQEERWSIAKHRGKDAKDEYHTDYVDKPRKERLENIYDRRIAAAANYNFDFLEQLAAFKRHRAVEYSSTQTDPSQTLQLAVKSKRVREKGRRYNEVMIGDGICQSIDVRNSVVYFSVLRGCRVIEGFLQIVLIEHDSEEDFEKLSFPELREITGYLLLYRVYGIRTLKNLFPNLEVIRGSILLTDYAFMIYELDDLQEIGLVSLTTISRGGVRIEKNPILCFTDTVNWDLIAPLGENFVKYNGKQRDCPNVTECSLCPSGYCWGSQLCQKTEIHPPMCHSQCIGECRGPTESDCYVCKHYQHEGKCIESCPPHLYTYLARRCISKQECEEANYLRRAPRLEGVLKWRPFNGSCTTQCPDGYEDEYDERNVTTCRMCTGHCRKIANGSIINHISDAQRFRGTTIVQGFLELELKNVNPNIMKELTDAFGTIEEITDYLKITHSYRVTSLSFLKRLRVIKGDNLEMYNASLVVIDNPHLASLFSPTQKVSIERGRVVFHYNPRLCVSDIEQFAERVNISDFTDMEVNPQSNGNEVPCNFIDINITVTETAADHAVLIWDSYKPPKGHELLNYLLYYIETENENISYKFIACANNTWEILEVAISNSTSTVSKNLTNLKPYTKYAAYVKAITMRINNFFKSPVAQSKMIFFRTKTSIPTMPINVIATPLSDSEILLSWEPPTYPNGPLGYYMISGAIRPDDEKFLAPRNYCKYRLQEEEEIITVKTPILDSNSCCNRDNFYEPDEPTPPPLQMFCDKNNMVLSSQSHWKDSCISNNYNSENTFYDEVTYLSGLKGVNITTNQPDPEVFMYNVSACEKSHILKNLRHYSRYTIMIAACGMKMKNNVSLCSSIEYANTRTKKRQDADDIRNVNVYIINETVVEVLWDLPRNPNGLIVSYTFEYKNLNIRNAAMQFQCISNTGRKAKYNSHYLMGLNPGKYRLRIRSTSLAGDGPYTDIIYFSVGLSDDHTMIIITMMFCCTVSIGMVAAFFFVRRNRREQTRARLIASVNPDYIEAKYVLDSWEVPREQVEIAQELGMGNFGMVYRGYLNGVDVAIKTISDDCSQRETNEFLNEASVMKNFSTYHVIKLMGVVSVGTPPLVIMELMENGDLKTYLRKIRDTNMMPSTPRIVRMVAEIADGMAYLQSKKYVHRDLAARNCMMTHDLICKVGDFGMARDVYETDYYKIGKKGMLPVRWMAPESLADGIFTSDSDVWSYGVVLYEILTLAEMPYQGFSNEEVLDHVLNKGVLNIPRRCPKHLQDIMEKCFKWRPSERPTFMDIVADLERFLDHDFYEKSFYHSEPAVEIRALGIKRVHHQPAPVRFYWGNETAKWVKDFEDNVTLLDQTKAGTSRGRIFRDESSDS